MAVIGAGTVVYQKDELGVRVAVIALRKITASDTIDVSTVPVVGLFTTVWNANFAPTSNRTATPAECTIAGTTLTINGAGLATDGGVLTVVGEY